MKNDLSRIDLHVHSRYSHNAGDWWLQAVGGRECYTTPQDVYQRALRGGMDFVTLTDHNTIEGALQLEGLRNFFISEEVTSRIPESGAILHVIALHINERIHQDIQYYRDDVYELVSYLRQENIVHFVAHPFFRMGSTLSINDLEKMLLLFNVIEVQNGGKQLFPPDLLERIIRGLTPELMWEMAERHNLLPYGRTPWRKTMVAGSDDHGGILIGHPHTIMPKVKGIDELLQAISEQKCWHSQERGQALSVAHHIFAVVYNYARDLGKGRMSLRSKLLFGYVDGLLGISGRSPKCQIIVQAALWGLKKWPFQGESKLSITRRLTPFKASIVHLLRTDAEWQHTLIHGITLDPEENKRLFGMMNRLITMVLHNSLEQKRGIRANIPAFIAIIGIMVPYLVAFRNERRDLKLMRQVQQRVLGYSGHQFHKRTAVFIDMVIHDEISKQRVLNKIEKWGLAKSEASLFAYSVVQNKLSSEQLHTFMPTISFALKAGADQMVLPPVLEVVQVLFQGQYDSIQVRTMGPMGILGILLGKVLDIPVSLTYPYHVQKKIQKQAVGHHQTKTMFLIFKLLDSLVHEYHLTTDIACQQAIALGIQENKVKRQRRSGNEPLLEAIKELMKKSN